MKFTFFVLAVLLGSSASAACCAAAAQGQRTCRNVQLENGAAIQSAALELIALRTQHQSSFRLDSVRLEKCGEDIVFSIEDKIGGQIRLWIVTFNEDFTRVRVAPPE